MYQENQYRNLFHMVIIIGTQVIRIIRRIVTYASDSLCYYHLFYLPKPHSYRFFERLILTNTNSSSDIMCLNLIVRELIFFYLTSCVIFNCMTCDLRLKIYREHNISILQCFSLIIFNL